MPPLQQCQLMLLVYCNIQRLPSCKVMRLTQTCQNGGVNGIQISLVGFLHEGGKPEPQYCPQIFRPQLPSGEIVYAMVFKPHNFQLGVKYPTVLNVYGGPEVQTVNNTFKVCIYFVIQVLTKLILIIFHYSCSRENISCVCTCWRHRVIV